MKSTTLFIAVLITLLFTSCVEQQTPEQATEAFLQCLRKQGLGNCQKKCDSPWN